jgi:large subunit ribosomal protein L25
MQEIKLKLDARSVQGKKVAKLRNSGLVPSVIYGHGNDPQSTQSAELETIKVVKVAGRHSPVSLTIDGKKQLAIIKSLDFDPVKHKLRHIAFQAISQNEEVTTEVAIHLDGVGESAAEKAGLIVLQALERIEVKAKPADLPEVLHLSIVDLVTAEDKLTLADVKLPEGVLFADDDEDLSLVIANVYEPGALQAANEASGGDAEDVELEGTVAEDGGGEGTGIAKPGSEKEEKNN